MKRLTCALCALLMLLPLAATEQDTITIFTIGDSTMANKPTEGDNPERGWGQMLPGFFTENIRVDNHARNGRSSKSFIDEGLWEQVRAQIRPGDYVFIQFGHNDEKDDPTRHTDPGTTFDTNLRRFVEETRAKGGIPVLFNSIVRRNFYDNQNAVADDDLRREKMEGTSLEGDSLIDTHGAYLDSPRNVAAELDVPFVDLNRLTYDLVQGMGREASQSLYCWVAANTCAACPKGRQDNTHLSIQGARRVARLAVDALGEAVPALKPCIRHYDFVVAKDGSGDFLTVQDAINAVPDFRKNKRTTILVRPGEYKERVIVPECKINISLIGQTGAVITNDGYASKLNSLQDTLYTYGKGCRQYYEDCYVEGTVDFIFGWSTAVFNRCTVHSLSKGYLTAPSTDKEQKYGYVFYDCKMTAEPGVEGVALSRPWRPYAKAVFIRCNLGGHIAPAGWNNWGKKSNEETVTYAEYQNTGEGARPKARAPYGHQLKDLTGYGIEEVLAGTDGWNPVKNGNALVNIKR